MISSRVLHLLLIVFSSFMSTSTAIGQGSQSVLWRLQSAPLNKDEVSLTFTASVADGWHLYSQFQDQGSRFEFKPSADYQLVGSTLEEGDLETFYDDLTERDVIWYSEAVTFQQKIKLIKSSAIIRGTIRYLTCNGQLCVPHAKEFKIEAIL